jgi:hypothetical protein
VDSTHIAWATGLFDGEGCITLYNKTVKGYEYRTVQICMTMTDEDLVRRFHDVVQVGNVTFRESKNPRHKNQWAWQTQSRKDIIHVLRMFLPWFGSRRAQKAREAIELCEYKLSKRK